MPYRRRADPQPVRRPPQVGKPREVLRREITGAGFAVAGAEDAVAQRVALELGDAATMDASEFAEAGHTHIPTDVVGLGSLATVTPTGTPDGTKFLRDDNSWQTPAAGGVSDGDKGDIVVSGSGSSWAIDSAVATTAGRAVMAAADAAAQRTALGLGTAAVENTGAFEASGAVATHAAVTTTHGISTFGATLVDDADAATARTTLGVAAAPTGTPDGTKYLRDDNSWQAVSGGSGLTSPQVLARGCGC